MKEENLLQTPWSTTIPAVLLDEGQNAIESYNGYHLRTDLQLCFNHWRPNLEVKLNLSDRPRGRPIDRANGVSTAQGLDRILSITFSKAFYMVIRALVLTSKAYESYDLLEQREIDELPANTKAVIDRLKAANSKCIPILLEVNYRSTETLTSNLTLQRPEWARILGDHGRTAGRLMLLVDATSLTSKKLETLARILQDGRDPLCRFCTQRSHSDDVGGRRQSYDRKEFMKKAIANPYIQGLVGYQATNMFLSLREYSTIFCAGAVLDRMNELNKVAEYEKDLKTLVLVRCADDGPKGGFYGFIDAPSNKSFRLRVGDCLDVEFRGSGGLTWRAVVASPVPVWRAHMIPLLIYSIKTGVKKGEQVRDSFEPKFIEAHGKRTHELRDAVAADDGNSVDVKVVGIGDMLDSICRAYETLDDFRNIKGSSGTAYTERMIKVLTSRRLDVLPHKDLYEPLRDQMSNAEIQKYMKKLNVEQSAAIESSRKLRASIQIIQGPPGTGKTFLLQQMVVPFLVSERESMVLVSTPTNHGADDLAREIRQALYDLRDDPKLSHLKKRYILRLHAPQSEDAIMRTQGPKMPKQQANNVKTSLPPKKTQRVLKGAALQMLDQFRANDGSKFEGVRDKRVQDIAYSAGYMMLLVSGVIPGTEYEEKREDHDPYAEFRELYTKHCTRREPFENTIDDADGQVSRDESKFLEVTENLYKAVLQGASVVVSTTAGISGDQCLQHIRHKVSAVFLDENAHEREDSLAPLFAAHFKLDPCIVLVGDQEQLAPLTQADKQLNAFSPQLEISWMARLIKNGMNYTMLTEQHRMVEDIVLLCNTLTYKGKLTNAPSTALSKRPNAMLFRQWARLLTKTTLAPTNRMMLDITRSRPNITRTKKGSKYNDYFVCVVSRFLPSLLEECKNATVAILTGYSEQRGNYLRMLGNMKEANVKNIDKLSIDTFDGGQGRQFDFVIVDLPVNHGVGFLADSRRLNVALSRARNGLLVVCDSRTILAARGMTDYLENLIKLFKGCTMSLEGKKDYPGTSYFTPADDNDDSDD